MQKNILFFLTGVLLAVSGFGLFSHGMSQFSGNTVGINDSTVGMELQNILGAYLPKPSDEQISHSVLAGYVRAYGDQFTTYFDPEEVVSFQTMIQGDFEGIGAYVDSNTDSVYIQDVLPGSPAQESGLLPGDVIQSVDGESLFGKTADYAVSKIRGPAGTPVVLEIFSTILGTKKDVTLIRRHLEIPIIKDELKGDVLHISLFSFNDYSGIDVEKVLEKYAGQYKSVLLDLRDNGGGTLQAAVDVGSLFLSGGKIIATVDGADEYEQHISVGKEDFKTPLYLLVNGNTASAAEILASALHEHLNAPIIGSQTYGKGSVQQIFELSNGGQVKVTIAHWKTAGGDLLDGVGIKPDTIILPTAQDITEGKDTQLTGALKEIEKTN